MSKRSTLRRLQADELEDERLLALEVHRGLTIGAPPLSMSVIDSDAVNEDPEEEDRAAISIESFLHGLDGLGVLHCESDQAREGYRGGRPRQARQG